jgi:hypothetical protein
MVCEAVDGQNAVQSKRLNQYGDATQSHRRNALMLN